MKNNIVVFTRHTKIYRQGMKLNIRRSFTKLWNNRGANYANSMPRINKKHYGE